MSDYFALSFTHVYTFDAGTGKLNYERMRLLGSSNPTTPASVYPPGTSHLPILGKDTEGLVEEVVVRRGQAVYFVDKTRSGESHSDRADDPKKQERAVRKAKKEVRDMERMARELEAALLQPEDSPAAQRDDDSDDDSDTDNSFSSNGSSEADSSFSSNDSDDDMESIIITSSPSLAPSASSSSLFSDASSSFISSAADDGAVDEADREDECSPTPASVVIDISPTVANKVALDVALPVVAAAWSGSWDVTPASSSLPRPGVTVNVSTPSFHTRGLRPDDERQASKRKADDDIFEDFRTKRCSPDMDAPVSKKFKSSHTVVAPSPVPIANSAPPARNFLLKVAPKCTSGSPASRAPRPIRPLPSSASSIIKPAFGQKRKREADDKEDGELSDYDRHSHPAPAAKKPRTIPAPGPSTKVVSRATSRAPAPFVHSRPTAASTRDLSRTTQPVPVPTSTAHLRPAADLAHRRWEERMKQMQGGGRIRVVSTDLLAMHAKVRRPRAMQGGR